MSILTISGRPVKRPKVSLIRASKTKCAGPWAGWDTALKSGAIALLTDADCPPLLCGDADCPPESEASVPDQEAELTLRYYHALPSREQLAERDARPLCPMCEDDGWVERYGGARVACPECSADDGPEVD